MRTQESTPLSLLIDFCNVKSWDVATLRELYQRHRIVHEWRSDFDVRAFSPAFAILQHEISRYCVTRRKQGILFYFTEDAPAKPPVEGATIFTPSQPGYDQLWNLLEESQAEYRGFLDGCVHGDLNVDFVNERVGAIEGQFDFESAYFAGTEDKQGSWESTLIPKTRRLFSFVKTEDGTIKPKINVAAHSNTLETAIDIEIANTLLRGDEEVFSKTKKPCRWCGGYFVYKRQRKEFCSDKCRLDFNNDKDRRSGKRRTHYLNKRAEGNEKYF